MKEIVKLGLLTVVLSAASWAGVCSSTSLSNGFTCVQSAKPTAAVGLHAATFPGAMTAGNTSIVFFEATNDETASVCSDPTNGTYTTISSVYQTSANFSVLIAYAVNIASSAAVTVTCTQGSTNGRRIDVLEVSGIATSSPTDGHKELQNNNSSPHAGNITTTNAIDLLVTANLCAATGATGGTGYTVLETDGVLLTQALSKSATGTYDVGVGSGCTSGEWATVATAFKAPAASTFVANPSIFGIAQ